METVEARVSDWTYYVGERVAVDSRTCADDALDFAGHVGVIDEVYDDGEFQYSVHFGWCEDGESYSFNHEDLCAAKGFMPGATDKAILEKLLGKQLRWYNAVLGKEETEYVKPTNVHKPFYEVVRNELDANRDYVCFVGLYGFRAVYLTAIIGVGGDRKRRFRR